MRLARLRLLATAALLSAPLGVLVCNKAQNNSAIERVVNKTIETERKVLQNKEHEFVKNLTRWIHWLSLAGSNLRDYEKVDDPFTQLNFAEQEFSDTRLCDTNDAIIPPETTIEKVIDTVNKVVESIKPSRKMKNDFYKDPSKDQIEAFIKLITKANEVAPLLVLDKMLNNVERDGKAKEDSADEIKKSQELALRTFKIYKKILDELVLKTPELIQSIEKFNEDAHATGQLLYKSRWGLSLEFLRSLKSIK